jgi:hypothetical protein
MALTERLAFMLGRLTLATAACFVVATMAAPLALAQPQPAPPPAPVLPPDMGAVPPAAPVSTMTPITGAVPSATSVSTVTPDGWTITVAGTDETQQPVPALTTAVSSREYVVGGTFTGLVSGNGRTQLTGGVLEVGYQIGCGIDMTGGNGVELQGQAGLRPQQIAELNAAGTPTGFQTRLEEETIGGVAVFLKPGLVNNVEVSRKDFRGTNPRITITGFHIKIDGCVGQSFIRSYATLTASTEQTSDVITYMGVTKAV